MLGLDREADFQSSERIAVQTIRLFDTFNAMVQQGGEGKGLV